MEEILAEHVPHDITSHVTEEPTEKRDESIRIEIPESHVTDTGNHSGQRKSHLTDSKAEHGQTKGTSHISTSYCLPYWNTSRTGLTRSFPASSCAELRHLNSTISSGHYWVDPNLGCSADSILVYCNFSSNETCIFPTQTQVCSKTTRPLNQIVQLAPLFVQLTLVLVAPQLNCYNQMAPQLLHCIDMVLP